MDRTTPTFNKALRYLSFRPRSEKELRDYLLGKNLPQKKHRKLPSMEIIDTVIKHLKDMKFLNDAEFAKSWVRSRTEYKPRSLSVIRMELKQKGITAEMIDEALAERREGKDDKELAKELLLRKKRLYEGMEKQERYRKAGGFLARKGFSFEAIKAAIDEIFR